MKIRNNYRLLMLTAMILGILMFAGFVKDTQAATQYAVPSGDIQLYRYKYQILKIGSTVYYSWPKAEKITSKDYLEVQDSIDNDHVLVYYKGYSRWMRVSDKNKLKYPISVQTGYYNMKAGVSTSSTERMADVYYDRRNARVNIYQPNGDNAQIFRFARVSSANGGLYTIRNYTNDQALTLTNGFAFMKNYTGSAYQKWRIFNAGGGYLYLQNAGTKTFLDVPGGVRTNNLQLWGHAFNGSNAQKWRLIGAEPTVILNGTYSLISGVSSFRVLDVHNGDIWGNMEIYSWLGNNNQLFEIREVSGGWHSIRNVGTGQYMAAALQYNGKSTYNAKMCYADLLNDINVKPKITNTSFMWKFKQKSNGYTYIINKKNNHYLAVEGNINRNGMNVWLWPYFELNAKGERWTIMKH